MKLFIDTANVEEIVIANDMGIVSGVTTNPSLIAKEGRDFHQTIREIAEIVDGPISAEVIALEYTEMVKEAEILSKIHPNVVIKLPMTKDGLKAVKILTSKGIKTNVTLVFSAAQALLAAKAGATYVSPFVGRLDDIGFDGINLISEIVQIFDNYDDIKTEIIGASIRNPIHATETASVGCDIATVPFKVLMQMFNHPLTDKGIEQFITDWETKFNK